MCDMLGLRSCRVLPFACLWSSPSLFADHSPNIVDAEDDGTRKGLVTGLLLPTSVMASAFCRKLQMELYRIQVSARYESH